MSIAIFGVLPVKLTVLAGVSPPSDGFAGILMIVVLLAFIAFAWAGESVGTDIPSHRERPNPPPPPRIGGQWDYYHGDETAWSAYRARHRNRDSYSSARLHRHVHHRGWMAPDTAYRGMRWHRHRRRRTHFGGILSGSIG